MGVRGCWVGGVAATHVMLPLCRRDRLGLRVLTPAAHAHPRPQVLRVGQRLLRCMAKFFAGERRLAAAGNAALLGRALRQRVWEDAGQLCRQLPNGARARACRRRACPAQLLLRATRALLLCAGASACFAAAAG